MPAATTDEHNEKVQRYALAQRGISKVRRDGAATRQKLSKLLNDLRGRLGQHLTRCDIHYVVSGVETEDGVSDVVAMRRLKVTRRRVTAEAIREAWDSLDAAALQPMLQRGEQPATAAMEALEELLEHRLATHREQIEVVERGSTHDTNDGSVTIEEATSDLAQLIGDVYRAKLALRSFNRQQTALCKEHQREVKALHGDVEEALAVAPGGSIRVSGVGHDGSDVFVRSSSRESKPKLDLREALGPVVETALTAVDLSVDPWPASTSLDGCEVVDRPGESCAKVSIEAAPRV